MTLSKTEKPKSVLEKSKKIEKIAFMPIAVACIFFFNAFINIIDIIPDFIGYIIISSALAKLAALNSTIEESSKMFRYMICVDLSKYVALMWIFGVTFGDEQSNATLLLTFVYALIESAILISAFSKLFLGLTELGYVHNNTAVLGSKTKGGRSYTEKINSFTIFFIVARALLCVLPELSVLTITEYTEGSFVMYLYEYIGTMRVLAFLIATIFGFVWLVKMFGYFTRIKEDRAFCGALVERYNTEIVQNESIFVKRQTSIAALMLTVAAAFMIDFRLGGVSIIPDALGAVFFVVAIVSVGKLVRLRQNLMISLAALFAFVNVARGVVEYKFFDEYYYGAVYRSPEVYSAYLTMCIVSVVTVIAQLLLCACVIMVLWKIIDSYTGFSMGEDTERSRERLDELHKELRNRILLIVAAGAVISAATELFFIFGAIKYGFADEIAFVGSAILMITIIKAFSDVREEIDAKYMLE